MNLLESFLIEFPRIFYNPYTIQNHNNAKHLSNRSDHSGYDLNKATHCIRKGNISL